MIPASTIDYPKTDANELNHSEPFIRRSAFYLGDRDEQVFAWLHHHSQRGCVDHGVIICPPIGHEQLHSHRSLRYLADNLAVESIPTLRFDWHGTGDSPGSDEDPHRFRAWLNNITQAIHWMRRQLGCRQISLIGLRLGGSLATLATLENEIDNLVLWSPVIKGRTFVREMKAIGLTSAVPGRRAATNPNNIEAAGFVLSSETAADVGLFDLTRCRPQCERVLVVSRDDLTEDDRLCSQWATLGIRVRQIAVPGFVQMMAEPHHNQVPLTAIGQIREWLVSEINFDARTHVANVAKKLTSSISLPVAAIPSDPDQTPKRILESTFTVNSQPELFGIVSQPKHAIDAALPTIVLLNAGSVHRIGPNRLNVHLGRRLAAQGFRCVRIDLSGLGDSITNSPEHENDPYPATAFRDIDLTMRQIERDFGTQRIVLMGLCSGAYAAFQSAAQNKNPVLVESVLINPLTYFWREGMTLDDSPTKHLRSFHYYQSVALDPRKWLKLLSGNSKIGIRGAIRLVARRLKLLNDATNSKNPGGHETLQNNDLSHPAREDLEGDLKRIASEERHLTMFFSTSDPGFGILNFHARRKVSQLQATGQLSIGFIEEADHTFTMQTARMKLIDAIASHLSNRYQSN